MTATPARYRANRVKTTTYFTMASPPSSHEHPHLSRRSHLGVVRPHRAERHPIAELPCHPVRPRLELGTRPLEAMVGVAQRPGGEHLPANVVLAVWRRQHHRAGPGELEHDALERSES